MMAMLSALGVLLHLLIVGKTVAIAQKENSVLVLNSSNIEGALSEHELLMIDFYTPWCGHCEKLEPEYALAAKELEGDGLVLGKVDCDANEALCNEDRWDIAAYPTIKIVRGGTTVHDYSGPGKANDITHFMRQLAILSLASGHYSSDEEGEEDYDDDDEEDYDDDDGYGDYEGEAQIELMEENGILLLAAHNFDAAVDRFVIMMVMFYNPVKSYSAELEKEYLAASEALYEFYIPLAKVDCFLQKEFCEQKRWEGIASNSADLPAIMAVRGGGVFQYDPRPRKAYNMVAFMKALAGIEENAEGDDDNGGTEADETNVMQLDAKSLSIAVRDSNILMVEFFAPWCGNCERLRPRYAKAATELVQEGVPLAKVDCTENQELCLSDPWRVTEYPTIYISHKGKLMLYEGLPEYKDIVAYMRKMNRPRPMPLANMREFMAFVDTDDVVVVGTFAEKRSKAFENFKAVAEGDLSISYGVSFDPEVRQNNMHESADVISVFRGQEEDMDEYPRVMMSVRSFTTKENMASFIRSTSRRLVLKIGSIAATKALAKRSVSMIIFTEDEEYPSASTLELVEKARKLAKDGTHPMVYIHAPLDKSGESLFDLVVGEKNRKGNVPLVAIVAPDALEAGVVKKYIYNEEEVTLEGLQEFSRRYFDGELKPYLKSEALAEADAAGLVKVVKGKSFESVVMDNENDVLVDFYAPWCKHCKRFAPVYEELAEKLRGWERLVVAKMDVASNDIPHSEVNPIMLPVVYLFKAFSKESPEKFVGEHDVASLEKFVKDKAYHKPVAAEAIHSEL